MNEGQVRNDWERARTIAAIIIQPHVKKKITPKQLLPLPWDKEHKPDVKNTPKLTAEEQRRRFEELVHQLGDK